MIVYNLTKIKMECKFCGDGDKYICEECKKKQQQWEKDGLTIGFKLGKRTSGPITMALRRKIKTLYPDKNK